MRYEIKINARKDLVFQDIALDIPFTQYACKYSIGLGLKGGYVPKQLDWKWNSNHQDTIWIGNTNAGLRCKFKDKNYKSPFINVYYNHRPLNKPLSWNNKGKGGIRLKKYNNKTVLSAYTGSGQLVSGESLTFVFEFLITPFKLIDYKKHWNVRYYHAHDNPDLWIDTAAKNKCNYINVHHGTKINPFIKTILL